MSGQTVFDKPVRPATLCRCGETEISQFEEVEELDLTGVEKGADGMSEETGDEVEVERELAPSDRESKSSEQTDAERINARAVQRLAHTLHEGLRTQP